MQIDLPSARIFPWSDTACTGKNVINDRKKRVRVICTDVAAQGGQATHVRSFANYAGVRSTREFGGPGLISITKVDGLMVRGIWRPVSD